MKCDLLRKESSCSYKQLQGPDTKSVITYNDSENVTDDDKRRVSTARLLIGREVSGESE